MLKQLCFIVLFVGLSIPAVASTGRYNETVVSIADNVTYCESHNKHDGVWGKAGEYGKAQFKPKTFTWMKTMFHKPGYSIINEGDQVDLLREAIKRGYGNHWSVCYKKAVKRVMAQRTLKRRTQMVATLLGTKSVDSIVASFQKTLAELDSHADKMYADVAKKENMIMELAMAKSKSLAEYNRAKSIRTKLDNLLT